MDRSLRCVHVFLKLRQRQGLGATHGSSSLARKRFAIRFKALVPVRVAVPAQKTTGSNTWLWLASDAAGMEWFQISQAARIASSCWASSGQLEMPVPVSRKRNFENRQMCPVVTHAGSVASIPEHQGCQATTGGGL